MKYSFQIDTGHLSYQYNGYYEDFDVELSDEQFEQLCITLKDCGRLKNCIVYIPEQKTTNGGYINTILTYSRLLEMN